MSVSKRLRFEVLRRDNHACRYCGAAAPDVVLTVDHVVPQALGGSDDPTNLVAACVPCNSGKSASSPDSTIVADVAADAARWAIAMRRASEIQRADWAVDDHNLNMFRASWALVFEGSDGTPLVPLPDDYEATVLTFLRAGLDLADLERAAEIALAAVHVPVSRAWKYFCGVAWRLIEQRREIATALLQSEEASTDGS